MSRLFALLACALFACAAFAQATDSEPLVLNVIPPFSIEKLADLEFGIIMTTGSGTVTIDPESGARTATGAVSVGGSDFGPAIFHTRGLPNGVARVRIRTKNVTLTQDGGTATLRLRQLHHDLGGGNGRRHRLDENGDLVFRVGGELQIQNNQPRGRYSGTFRVETSYP
ncbi:MAG: DUF4402 domain-containing protein [Pacificimonas sp.]|jgi:hypothetical protein|nr:DUF4402 domain-containing protein [Pacificimonas sp.]